MKERMDCARGAEAGRTAGGQAPTLAPLLALLEESVAAGGIPAAQTAVIHRGRLVHLSAHGSIEGHPTTVESRFDVASLSKVMATATAAGILLSRGAIDWEDSLVRWFPGAGAGGASLRQLLAHQSGLPAWAPFFAPLQRDPELRRLYEGAHEAERFAAARKRVVAEAAALPPQAPPGGPPLYGDPAYILLGELLAQVATMPWAAFCEEAIFRPLALEATSFRPLPAEAPPAGRIAPTGRERPRLPLDWQEGRYEAGRGDEPPGAVDDDNAWAMGGVAGHAGLFSTALDVARWGQALLEERAGAGRLMRAEVLEALLRPLPGGQRALAFDMPAGERSTAGRRLGRAGPQGARGHLGFTGCSVWVDLDRELVVALLTNRVFAGRRDDAVIRRLRPEFHDRVLETLEI